VRVIDDPARPGEPLPQVDDGVLVDSARFSGFASAVARSEITVALKEAGRGGPSTIFHLRDWSVGRQRYWGCPIPIVYCPQCGTVAEDRLPVLLPSMDLLPTGRLQLSAVESFVNTTCPQCGAAARRETDTLDTFFDSAWYAFRFTDPHNDRLPFGREAAERWMPIDFYVGGLEHASQHMLYFRFITKCLFDLGLVGFDEPVDHFFFNGMVRFGGHKMSKSRGNIVVPTEIVEKYGADALRLYILSDAPAEFDIDWNDQGIVAKLEFVGRNVRVLGEFLEAHRQVAASDDFTTFETRELLRLCYASILSIQTSLDANSFHTAVARIHEFSNGLRKALSTPTSQANIGGLKYLVREFLVVFGVFAPFAAEYLYRRYFDPDGSIYTLEWPRMRSEFLSVASVEIVVQVNGKKRGVLSAGIDASEEEVERAALSHESVATALKDKSVIRRLYVQNKILNFIVAK
jgi:leucyl-tRNA synthetase